MQTKKLTGRFLGFWSYVIFMLLLSFQNCGPSFSSVSSDGNSLDSVQGASVIVADNANNYSPNQNISFTFDQGIVGTGAVVWSNLLNSTTTCTEVSANNVVPYVINCTGKGILTITLTVNSSNLGVVGPLTSDFVINDGLPRSTSLVPFVITAATGDFNHIGVTPQVFVPSFLIAGNNYGIKEKPEATNPGNFDFSFNNGNRFLDGVQATWTLTGDCTGAVAQNGNFVVTCPVPTTTAPATYAINITLTLTGSDPTGGAFSIPQITWTGTYSGGADVTATYAGQPNPPAAAAADPISANYIGAQELLQTNVVFVGQTLRIFNKASASKQFGLSFNGVPCASTGPIPYSAAGDYSKFVDCVISAEFGDPSVGSPVVNTFDSSQKYYLIAIDGTKLYNNNCKVCHLDLSISRNQIGNETLARLKQAIQGQANSQPMLLFDNTYSSHLSKLTDPQKLAIIHALQN